MGIFTTFSAYRETRDAVDLFRELEDARDSDREPSFDTPEPEHEWYTHTSIIDTFRHADYEAGKIRAIV
ncbi:MAG: hypothetical protein IJ058_13080 [Lachnospiraceae bacterium]|nr:hypothetical protein [Lachnospiraceae bacterium]